MQPFGAKRLRALLRGEKPSHDKDVDKVISSIATTGSLFPSCPTSNKHQKESCQADLAAILTKKAP